MRLIHWHPDEARDRAARLEEAGHAVVHRLGEGPEFLRDLTTDPPDAVVIDLSRLPSQGRDVALTLRQRKATRHLPLIFLEGDKEKVERIMRLLPDALYSSWGRVKSDLKRALARPPSHPVVPASALAGYSGTPLPKKLGIKAGSTVAVVGGPSGFETTLGDLPEGVRLRSGVRGKSDLTLWFVRSSSELERGIARMAARLVSGAMWIAWPKKASGVATDLSERIVRETGLGSGLVDYKICAIDATWSGLLFTRRR